jgi:endonuclease/exonuclease/phosphatase (EEP) superfamily protein YafD
MTFRAQRLLAHFTVTTKLKFARTSKITVTVSFSLIAVSLTEKLSSELWQTQCHPYLPLWCFSTQTIQSYQAITQLIFRQIKASLFKRFLFKNLQVKFKSKRSPSFLIATTLVKEELTSSVSRWRIRCHRINEQKLTKRWPERYVGMWLRILLDWDIFI